MQVKHNEIIILNKIKGFFDASIMICIILNILTMAMAYEGSTAKYDTILEGINLFFTSVFILETILKLTAFGFRGRYKFRTFSLKVFGHLHGTNLIYLSLFHR